MCLICDVEAIRSIGLPDHHQNVTVFALSSMLALQWIKENVKKPRIEITYEDSIHAIDFSRKLGLFATPCKYPEKLSAIRAA